MKKEILSVGIDVGTSTTQLIFSMLTLENTASLFSVPRIEITGKRIIYKSDIHITPLKSQDEIDGAEIRSIVKSEYEKAGILPTEVDTGAVIITGETARKENAKEIAAELSSFAGDFVVSTAGPDLEAVIAGKGAGAADLSEKKNATVVNLDIGGGTTNIAAFHCGETIATGCLDIGGRLIKLDKNNHIVSYISPKIVTLVKKLGLNLEVGKEAETEELIQITDYMAKTLQEILENPSDRMAIEFLKPITAKILKPISALIM